MPAPRDEPVKNLLQGKPLGHPLHPALVHFPIALFVLSLLFDLSTRTIDASNALVQGAFYTMAGGVIMALVASLPGLVDWLDIRADHPAKRLGLYHMVLNLVAVALYAASAALRYRELDAQRVATMPFVLSLVGAGLLSVSGYLGGAMVYNDGIAVGRHRRKTPTPRETLHARGPAGEFIAVADSDELGEGETLRVEVDGQVATVVRLDGKLYAFQEFCTHRYGPLSEGSFVDGQVKCPWHGSCFDVKTGKVTHEPAKVDLKTFDVQETQGKIRLRAHAAGKPRSS